MSPQNDNVLVYQSRNVLGCNIDKLSKFIYNGYTYAVVVQLARTSPCQGEGRRFESGLPLKEKRNKLFLKTSAFTAG